MAAVASNTVMISAAVLAKPTASAIRIDGMNAVAD